MLISNEKILKKIFALKGNFSSNISFDKKIYDGIQVAPLKDNCRGAASISADFELCWAWRALSPVNRDEKARRARMNFPLILGILEEHNIPITWATVGHLFLRNCTRGPSNLPHFDMPRPPSDLLWRGDWYRHDPCTDFLTDPFWYAPDLIEQIMTNKVDHEIGCHSFSHIDLSLEDQEPQLVSREVQECIRAMAQFGLKPRSFVFPFNRMGYQHINELFGQGITSVRHRDRKVKISYPERTSSGLYKIYESMNLRTSKKYCYADKARIYLDEAAEQNAVFSFYFHPSDATELFENEFRKIVELIASKRDSGIIWVATMERIAAYCEAYRHIDIKTQRTENGFRIDLKCPMDIQKFGTPDISILFEQAVYGANCRLEIENEFGKIENPIDIVNANGKYFLINVPATSKSLRLHHRH